MKSLKFPSARIAACLLTLMLPWVASAQTVSFTGALLTENFDSMGAAGTTTPNGWYVGTNDQPGITVVTASAGGTAANANAGWNYGTAASSERALGTAATTAAPVGGTGTRFVEVRIVNDTGGDINTFSVQYDGEQWRAGSATAEVDTYVMRYSTDGTTFVNMGTGFNFNSPTRTPISSALDGNNPTNRVADIGSNYTPASPVPNGGIVYLRWFDANGPGTDGGIAVENFRFSTNLLGVIGVAITAPTNGQQFSDPVSAPVAATVTGASTNVDFYVDGAGTPFASDATSPYTATLTGQSIGMHTLRAVAQDAIGGSVTSAVVTIEVVANTAPSIVLTNPITGASFFVGDNATVNAVVTDGPGEAHSVSFFDNGVLRFTDTNAPFAITLGNLTAGPHTLTATVTDRGGLMASATAVSISVTNPPGIVTIITNGESWTYLDSNVDQNPLMDAIPAWTTFFFDDSAWSNNFAELGFGDTGDNPPRPEVTVINGGPTNLVYTTYFRKRFNVDDPGVFSDITLRMLRDDGVVVWLNGVEVARNAFTNTALTLVPFTELAVTAGDDGATYQVTNISPSFLLIGDNVIAVEVHQSATNSSDLSFDLMLWGVTSQVIAITTPTNGQSFIEGATVPVTAVANYGALEANFYVDNMLFASDNTLPGFTTVISNLTVGTHTVYAVGVDANAFTVNSATNTFMIVGNPPGTVAITNPPSGTGLPVGAFVLVEAEATDPQGVARVEFYDNGELRATDTSSPYSFTLGDLTFGAHSLTAVAVDGIGGSTVSAPVILNGTNPPGLTSIVTNGANWKYLDTGVDQVVAWIQPSPTYDDSGWSNGLAELGFGDGPERTVINGGPTDNRTRTIYFRKEFMVADPTVFSELRLDLLRDDGGVAYINGVEVFRSNMTNGAVPVLFTDFAGGATGSETTFVSTNLPRTVISAGANILAVEVHQNTTNSSDVSFDAMLWGITAAALNVTISTPTNGQSFREGTPVPVTAVPNFTATNMNFYSDGALVSSDTTTPYNASVAGLILGPHTLQAVGMDAVGNSITSAPVMITVFPNTPPTVAITNLLGGETFLVGTFTLVQADAADDGTVARVDFFDNGVLRFADSNAPFAFTLSDLTAGPHSLTAVATDDSSVSTPSAAVSINVTNPPNLTAVVTNGCTWLYLDDATDQGTAWRDAGFPDGTWAMGQGELGAGDAGGTELRPERTMINIGPAGNRTPTLYFRKTFAVADPSAFGGLRLDVMRDDGAIVYINGIEVFRSNMTNDVGNPVLFTDFAGPAIGGNAEQTFVSSNITASIVGAGATNQLAVEIHQTDVDSSDVSFDLMLWGASGCGPAPTMTVEKSGTDVIIRWPLAATGYVLVGQNVLDPDPLTWSLVVNGVDAPDATNHNVTVPIGDGNRFFRLRCP